jgi:hypothetical protein
MKVRVVSQDGEIGISTTFKTGAADDSGSD